MTGSLTFRMVLNKYLLTNKSQLNTKTTVAFPPIPGSVNFTGLEAIFTEPG